MKKKIKIKTNLKKQPNKKEVLTLSPKIIENEINDKYVEKLDELLDKEDCKNIALVGSYGSGKSSIIKTYLYKRKKISDKSMTITIGAYIIDNDFDDKIDFADEGCVIKK